MSHEMAPADNTPKDPTLSNKLYDFLKFLAQILLPAAGTAYSAIAALWGWGAVTQVVGTIVAVDTLLGAILAYLKVKYDNSPASVDGSINVVDGPDKKTFNLVLDTHPDQLEQQDKVVFKVNPTTPAAPTDNNGF